MKKTVIVVVVAFMAITATLATTSGSAEAFKVPRPQRPAHKSPIPPGFNSIPADAVTIKGNPIALTVKSTDPTRSGAAIGIVQTTYCYPTLQYFLSPISGMERAYVISYANCTTPQQRIWAEAQLSYNTNTWWDANVTYNDVFDVAGVELGCGVFCNYLWNLNAFVAAAVTVYQAQPGWVYVGAASGCGLYTLNEAICSLSTAF
jgi:hypothetical protein